MLGLPDNQSLLFPYALNKRMATYSLVERYSHASQYSLLVLLMSFVKYYFELAKSL